MSLEIAPSLLAADFARLAEAMSSVEGAADWLHVDVMDNHFVPNLTIGLPVVQSLAAATSLPLDCHLMIDEPDRWALDYVAAGAAGVTFHVEAAREPIRLARELRSAGVRAGMALRPATPVDPYAEVLDELDLVLVMTVEPGFGGQDFLEAMLPKVRRVRELVRGRDLAVRVQVDGGVNADTIAACAEAGADSFVAGSAVFGSEDAAAAVKDLRRRAEAAQR